MAIQISWDFRAKTLTLASPRWLLRVHRLGQLSYQPVPFQPKDMTQHQLWVNKLQHITSLQVGPSNITVRANKESIMDSTQVLNWIVASALL